MINSNIDLNMIFLDFRLIDYVIAKHFEYGHENEQYRSIFNKCIVMLQEINQEFIRINNG